MEPYRLFIVAELAAICFGLLLYCIICCLRFIRFQEEQTQLEAIAGDVGNTTSWPHSDSNEALDPKLLTSLPVFVYSSSYDQLKQIDACAVCLGEFEDDEKGRQLLPCFHRFHVDCIDMWLSSHSTCPMCRSLVGSLDV